MKQQDSSANPSSGKIQQKPGCGPSVDTWPILGAQGEEMIEEAEEEEEEE